MLSAFDGNGKNKNMFLLHVASTIFPLLLMSIAYIIEGEEGTENAELNVARHAFTCSMRFSDSRTEWALLWSEFLSPSPLPVSLPYILCPPSLFCSRRSLLLERVDLYCVLRALVVEFGFNSARLRCRIPVLG
jgi:hypothetical protein